MTLSRLLLILLILYFYFVGDPLPYVPNHSVYADMQE